MKIVAGMLLLTFVCVTGMAQHKTVISVNDFEKAIQIRGVQLVDVRTPQEFKEGYINGAVNADWQNEKQFSAALAKLDKNRPVYVYCLSGIRSGKAADWLAANGFKDIINLDGGIKAWKDADKKIVSK